jgi:hypothetical protein
MNSVLDFRCFQRLFASGTLMRLVDTAVRVKEQLLDHNKRRAAGGGERPYALLAMRINSDKPTNAAGTRRETVLSCREPLSADLNTIRSTNMAITAILPILETVM